ncbi:disease resistance protein At4g27190-like isoform X1 [Lycium barbarum]|uniref:disease resistance protein At4g27190-like isoform X1 n=2 Tax=Lycium barbarum TaxID=112863 RepID=UPI00293EFBBD|nr:disease resistance protein At4g27190-like isoform X1 [Lycium barbarum]XP_060179301.1 disease resistance protein At4g27190-like isoform X1 [Lycium barbarum]
MDILFSVVSDFVIVVGKFALKCCYPKIENTIRFSSNVENLREEMEKLTKFRDAIKEKVEGAEREGYKPKPNVLKWLEDVHELENEWESMQESIAAAKVLAYKCCPKCNLRLQISIRTQNMRHQLCKMIEIGENFESNLVVENYQMKRVEFIPGPSVEGQSAATRNLNKILQLLQDDKVFIIGIWGMGGVGKTTLVKYLNNELLKTATSSSKLSFGVVAWVTVPKPPIDIRKVQAQIVNRLKINVNNEESVESIASKIYQRLKQESFLLILDDVWEAINLDHIGVPQLEDSTRSKVILTSRFLDVCRQMKTDTEMKVYTLDEDESWQLFVEDAGDSANLEHIQSFAKEIVRECNGLPLAISVIGASMRGKKRVELWEDALESLKLSEPHNKDVKDKVYKVIKWSFDSLESQDIELSLEQRSKNVHKKRGDIQSCFLYCSLYPVAISTDDLINCWWAEGFLGEHDTYEEAYNRGITMIESLKDACLLEAHMMDSVKMHDVVRDVAIWIANCFRDEHNSLIQAGIGLIEISHIKMSASVKRISFVSNIIEHIPDYFTECPETTTLLLQDNNPLEIIPHEFFLTFPALRVLNLSQTGIRALPSSINSLYQLHALILQNCNGLIELPPIGDLYNLQLLDCDNTMLCCLPQGMDQLTNLRLLHLPAANLESIGQGVFLNLSSIEMLNMLESDEMIWTHSEKRETLLLGPTPFDEISSLQNLTSLSIKLDSSSIFNRDHTWMTRLKRFRIEVGDYPMEVKFNKSTRMIGVSNCEIFSNGELSGMLHFASDLYLTSCMGLRKLIVRNSFDGLKELHIEHCCCDFEPEEEESGQFDPLPNLEYLNLHTLILLKSVSDFGVLLGLRFSKLRQLNVVNCLCLKCLFKVGEAFTVPKHLEDIAISDCGELVELLVQCGSSQATLVNSEITRVQKLRLNDLPNLKTLGEPESMWGHLEELSLRRCNQIRKLPLSIQTSNNIKIIRGSSEWWSQLEWDDDKFKSNLEHCFLPGDDWFFQS